MKVPTPEGHQDYWGSLNIETPITKSKATGVAGKTRTWLDAEEGQANLRLFGAIAGVVLVLAALPPNASVNSFDEFATDVVDYFEEETPLHTITDAGAFITGSGLLIRCLFQLSRFTVHRQRVLWANKKANRVLAEL